MKTTLDKIKLAYAKHYHYKDWIDFLTNTDNLSHDKALDDISKEYAIEVAKQTQRNCAENARIFKSGNSGSYFDASINKDSILSETNIPRLD